MHKEPLITFLESKISEIESLKKYIKEEGALTVMESKIETLKEVLAFVREAGVPFDMI